MSSGAGTILLLGKENFSHVLLFMERCLVMVRSFVLFAAAVLGGGALANEPVIKVCVNPTSASLSCTADQRLAVARKAGMTAVSDQLDSSSGQIDVYVFSYIGNTVYAYSVSSRIEMIRGEERVVTSAKTISPKSEIVTDIQAAVRYMKDSAANGIDSSTLAWDYQAERPIESAHRLNDPGTASLLTQVISRTFSNAAELTTRTAVEVAKNLTGVGWIQGRTVKFPDGTAVVVKLVAIMENQDDGGVTFQFEIVPGTAKDGNLRIPLTSEDFLNIVLANASGGQLERFLDTARRMGIPITGPGGDVASLVCYPTTSSGPNGEPAVGIRCRRR